VLVSDETAAEAAAYLTRCEFVGLDTENVAYFEAGRPNRPVSKVQLCGRAHDASGLPLVYIWPLDRLGAAAISALKAFLTNSNIKKVGISVAHDVTELAKVGMALGGAVNVKDVLKSFFAPPSWSCEDMVDFCLGAIIDKNIDHRNWEEWPLTERQIECERDSFKVQMTVTLYWSPCRFPYRFLYHVISRYMAADAFAPFVLYELAQFRKTGAGRSPRAIYIIDDEMADDSAASSACGRGSTTTAAGRRATAGATGGSNGSADGGGSRSADNAAAAGGASAATDDAVDTDGAGTSGGASATDDDDGGKARATDGDGPRRADGAATSGAAASATNDDSDDEAMADNDREAAGSAAASGGGERGPVVGGITMLLRPMPDSPPILAVVDDVAPRDAEPDEPDAAEAAAHGDASPFAPMEGEARRVLDSLFDASAREIRKYATSERSDELHLPSPLTRRVPCLRCFALKVPPSFATISERAPAVGHECPAREAAHLGGRPRARSQEHVQQRRPRAPSRRCGVDTVPPCTCYGGRPPLGRARHEGGREARREPARLRLHVRQGKREVDGDVVRARQRQRRYNEGRRRASDAA